MTRWQRRIPRPSLLWMSIDDVTRVRNNIMGLYLKPGQQLGLPPPRGHYQAFAIQIVGSSGSTPSFQWAVKREGGADGFEVWLKVNEEGMPVWEVVTKLDDGIITSEQYPISHPRFRHLATIIKHFSRYFPFVSTDNYLVNGGQPIA